MKQPCPKTLFSFICLNIFFYLSPFYIPSVQAGKNSNENPFGKYWIASTKLFNSTRLKRNSLPCEQFHLNLKNYKKLTLCVYRQNLMSYDFLKNNSRLIVHENGQVQTSLLAAVDYISLIGYVIGQENNSKVDGYLYQGRFLGRIVIEANTIYVEDLVDYLGVVHLKSYKKEDSIIYQNDRVTIICPQLLISFPKIPQLPDGIFNTIFKLPYGFWNGRNDYNIPSVNMSRRACTLAIFVDTAYYKLVMASDDQKTLHSVVHSINVANSIFRSTDFLGRRTPTNIGFEIKQIQIFKTSHDSPLPSFYPFKRDSFKALIKFSNLDTTKANLAILFTGQSFQDNVNGLSYTGKLSQKGTVHVGGLCFQHPFGGQNRNALMVVGQGYSSRQTQLILDLTVAHEIGHSFGAMHDNDPQCKGYIMESVLENMEPGKYDQFSPCSLELISELLTRRNDCLETSQKSNTAFCGNGIVEDGEECDCGSKYTCEFNRSCCNHFDSTDGKPCTRNRNSQCKDEL